MTDIGRMHLCQKRRYEASALVLEGVEVVSKKKYLNLLHQNNILELDAILCQILTILARIYW